MKRKLIIAIPLLCSVLMSACMPKHDPDYLEKLAKENAANARPTESTEATKESRSAADSSYNPAMFAESPWKIKDTVILDKNNIKITAKDVITYNKGGYYAVVYWVENYTNNSIFIDTPEIYINTMRYGYETVAPQEVPGNTSTVVFTHLYFPYLEEFGIEQIATIDVKLAALNSNNAVTAESDIVSIGTNYLDEVPQPDLIDGILIADNDVCKVRVKCFEKGDYNLFYFFVTNKTDQIIHVCTPTLNFGSVNLEEGINFGIPPKTSVARCYDFNNPSILQSLGGAPLTGFDISAGYRLANTTICNWMSETVHIDVDLPEKAILEDTSDTMSDDE